MSGIVVCGYGDVGYRCTKWLLDAGEPVRLVYSHPDARDEERWWESVADLARSRGVAVKLVESLDAPSEEAVIRAAAPDFLFSFSFRAPIPAAVLAIPSRGALDVHSSLLPAFRGGSPVNWAILKGATATGASLHYLPEKPDAIDLVDQEQVPIGPEDDALTVSRRVSEAAVSVLARAWPKLKAGTAPRTRLDLSKGSTFPGRKPEDDLVDWLRPAQEVHDLVRAVSRPWAGAFTDVFGPRVTIWKTRVSGYGGHDTFPGKVELTEGSVIVFCGDDRPVEILLARPEGQADMNAATFRSWVKARG